MGKRCQELVHTEFDTTLQGKLDSHWREAFHRVHAVDVTVKLSFARVAGKGVVHVPASSAATVMARGLRTVSENGPLLLLEPVGTAVPDGLAVLGLRFCARAFSSCGKWGPLFIAMRGPLTIAASLVAEHNLQTRRLSSCGSRAQSLRGMWDPPRPVLEPVSPAPAGRLSTTAPPGKPLLF